MATKRTVLRLRAREEASANTPTRLLWFSGAALILCGVLMGVGEGGIRRLADGDKNVYSRKINVLVPGLVVTGLFNTVLASKTSPSCSRMLTLLILSANAACGWMATLIGFQDNFFVYRNYDLDWSFGTFSHAGDFPSRWLEQMGPENALPLSALASYNALRTIPFSMACILPTACALCLVHALVAVSKRKTEGARGRSTPATRRARATAFAVAGLGVIVLLASFLQGKYLSDLSSFLQKRYFDLLPLHLLSLSALGLGAIGLGTAKKSPAWARVGLLALVGGVFFLSYSVFETVDRNEDVATSFHILMGSSKCKEDLSELKNSRDRYTGGYDSTTTTTTATTTTATPSAPDQVCFSEVSEDEVDGGRSSVVCLPKSKMCDGKVDLAKPVTICTPTGYQSYKGIWARPNAKYVFADELFCPMLNGTTVAFGGLRGLLWLQLVLCLALIAALGLGSWDAQEEEKDREEEKKERRNFLNAWDEFREALFSKAGTEEQHNKRRHSSEETGEVTPIIKKKLDSPC